MSEPTKTTREAVEDFGRFARLMETTLELWRHVESIENVERRANEANSRAALAEEREANAIKRAADAETAFKADEERRRTQASKTLAEAEAIARTIRSDAEAYADRVKRGANDEAANTRKVSETAAALAGQEAAKWRGEASAMQQSIEKKREELAGLERQIAEARAVISKLMGA